VRKLLAPVEAQEIWATRSLTWEKHNLNPERVQFYLELMKANQSVSEAYDCVGLKDGKLRCGHHRIKAITMMDKPVEIHIRDYSAQGESNGRPDK